MMHIFRRLSCLLALLAAGPALAVVTPPTISATQANGVMIVSWPQSATGFQLQSISSLNGLSSWQPVPALAILSNSFYSVTFPMAGASSFFRLGPAPLTTVLNSSPANGEIGVSVLRETILRFSTPLATNTLISPDQFYASTSAGRILTRVELASDGRSASLFYLEPMPGGSTVTVVFDGTGILDQSGRPIDPDGDGLAGGLRTIAFQTFNTTPVPNTAVIGYVYASVPIAGGNGATTNHPLANVTITVDGQEEFLRTTTDKNGAFSLNPCPVGRFFVKIDGRTASGSLYPSGAYYPFVGKPWEATAGVTNNLAGGTGVVYLPLVAAGTLQPTSLTTNTTITFPASVLAANPGLAGVFVTIPAGSLFSDDGTRGGRVGIAPVSPDRLPAPLPPGIHPALVITIQTDGADNLDQPAPVRFPNLPNPVTGVLLPPGAKTALWGFNHKSGRWEIQGPATISPDGRFIDTDPGYGVRQPGWELFDPANNGGGGGGGPGGPPGGPPPPKDPKDPCKTERQSAESTSVECVAGTVISIVTAVLKTTPGIGCAVSAAQGLISSVIDCNIDPNGCLATVGQNVVNTAIGCIPVIGGGLSTFSTVAGTLKSCVLDESLALANYQLCKNNNAGEFIHRQGMPKYFGDAIPNNIWDEQVALLQGFADVDTIILGDVAWTEVEPTDTQTLVNFYSALEGAMQAGSPGDAQITPGEQASLLTLPLPTNLNSSNVVKLVSRLNQLAAGTLPAAQLDRTELLQTLQELQATLVTLQARGWTTPYDAFLRGITPAFQAEDQAQASQPQSTKPLAYRVLDISTGGTAQYGRLNLNGQFDNLILNPNELYEVDYADLDTFYVGHTIFLSTGPGQATTIPRAALGPADPLDSNGDGVPDEVELALPDGPIDGDGFPDGTQIVGGKLIPGPAPTGIIGSAASQAEMIQIAVSGTVALVAESSAVAVYDISGDQPGIVSVLPLASTVASVAFSGTLGVATMDQAGIAVIDVSNPLLPQVARYVGVNGSGSAFVKVVAAGNLAYAMTGDTLYLFDIVAGQLLDQRAINATAEQAQPQDLAVSGGYLYLLTGHTRLYSGDKPGQHHLHKIRIDQTIGADAATLDMVGSNFVADVPTRIAATPGLVYLTGLNASTNPASPGLAIITDDTNGLQMIAPPTTALGAVCLAANGSGTVVVGGTNLSVVNTRNPQAGAVVVTNFALPALPRGLAISYGRAYVADDYSGLQVVAYYHPDTNGQPPSLSLGANFSLNPAVVQPGRAVVVSVATSDDVQVWKVQFYLNGTLAAVSGTAPFDFWMTTPTNTATNFTIQARAIDTGLNATWSAVTTVQVSASATPPAVTNVSPVSGSVNVPGLAAAQAFFSSALDPASVASSSLQVVSAGPDGILGTADDLTVPGTVAYSTNPPSLAFTPASPFAPGNYTATVGTGVTDLNGNHLPSAYTWNFTIKAPVQWTFDGSGDWSNPHNWSTTNTPQPGDFAVINEPNPMDTITFASGSASMGSLMSTAPLVLQSGTFSLSGPSSVASYFSLLGDTLLVSSRLDIGGQFNWESGTLDGGGVITANGIDIGGNYHHIGKITLVNRGQAFWHQAINQAILIDDPATVVVNTASGVFETVGNAQAIWNGYNAPYPQFNNQGLFHVLNDPNSATSFQLVAFNNSGVVQIDTGALNLAGNGGASSGEFNIAGGALLHFNADNLSTPGSSIHGAGAVRASSGNVTLNGLYDITGGTIVDGNARLVVNGDIQNTGPITANASGRLTLSATTLNLSVPMNINGGVLYLNSFNGTINATQMTLTNLGILWGTADVTVNGPCLVSGAIAFGPGRLILNGASSIGNLSLYVNNSNTQPRPIDNNGYLSLEGDIVAGTALIRNFAGATLDCVGDHRIASSLGNAVVAVINSGTVVKSTGAGAFVIDSALHNDGLVVANAGLITINGGLLQTGGETRLAGGNFGGSPNFQMEAGTVTGSGSVDVYQFENTGATVSPGLTNAPAGSFHFTHDYIQGPGGTLSLYIQSTSTAGYSHIAADGPSTLAGTLTIVLDPGYQPTLGDTFHIVQCSQATGHFGNVVLPALGGGLSLKVGYDNTGVTLTVAAGP